MKCVIGIDVGTSGCKILALSQEGVILHSVTEEYPLYTPQAGWSEQNPIDWWNGVVRGLKKTVEFLGDIEVSALGFSGQMHGMVALDENDEVIRPAILWNDQRTVKQCEEITAMAGGLDSLLGYTNNQMLTGFTGGKILWMKENEPENYAKTKIILNPKDYIRFKLSGKKLTEVSDASGTGYFDVKNRTWSTELMDKTGISKEIFPEVVESTDKAGCVSKEASLETGIKEGTILSAGGGDAVISTTGLGLIKTGRIGITLGTSGVVAMGLDNYIENPNGLLQVSCNNAPNVWHAMGVTLAAAGSYQWFRNTLGDMEMYNQENGGKNAFYQLDMLAKGTNPGADGVIFLPYLTGERAPINDPSATGAFLGLTSMTTKGHFARAVMEGVAYSLKQVFDLILKQNSSAKAPTEIVLAGGGANSPIWRQIFADLFNLPVRTVYGSGDGGSFGAALVASVTAGFFNSMDETVAVIKGESETLPDEENVEVYAKQYAKYVKMYDALKWSY